MRLRNDELDEEVILGQSVNRVLVQRIRGGVEGAINDHARPTSLGAEVEMLRLRDKYLRERYRLIDPSISREATPADRRAAPLFARPPWSDREAAVVEADRLQQLGDPLAEVVSYGTEVWLPTEFLGRLAEMRPLLELDSDCGFVRSARIGVHLGKPQLVKVLQQLFGMGTRGHVLEVILRELSMLEIGRHLESLTCCSFGQVAADSLEPIAAFANLRELRVEETPTDPTAAIWFGASAPEWIRRIEKVRLSSTSNPAPLLEQGAEAISLEVPYPGTTVPFSRMTPERWPKLRELVLLHGPRADEIVAALSESGLLDQLELLDLDRCSVDHAGAEEVAHRSARFPHLRVVPPLIRDATERKVAGLDRHPRQRAIDDLAPPEVALAARRLAYQRGFRDSGREEDEL